MSKTPAIGAALAVAILFAGCTATGGEPKPAASEPAGTNRPAFSAPAATEGEPTAAEETTEAEPTEAEATEEEQDAKPFGSSWTWEDGLSITVSKPKDYKPNVYAAGTEGFTKFVVFDVTLVNKSTKTWDPSMFSASMQSGNEEASEVYDYGKLKERPNTKLLKGREVTFQIAFGVKDPKDLVLEVTPDWERKPALYHS
ncbi:hypothetical protein M3G03_02855 [Aestuariimicrobium sp. p3-SID1156]|uniref:hypothetical protein n=1 Tax=Aestuariimicrobium sp. p3-SID1156 TaxID=2916038 RepID=UPI00223AEF28|nr:hypothetical protein [Aestuariimicrobium sp. p3-SID1156]MCT1458490.1 hypothetical protein [Aestuariimicrobium sp. p3-SID1156]